MPSRFRTVVNNDGEDDEVGGYGRRKFQSDRDRRGLESGTMD